MLRRRASDFTGRGLRGDFEATVTLPHSAPRPDRPKMPESARPISARQMAVSRRASARPKSARIAESQSPRGLVPRVFLRSGGEKPSYRHSNPRTWPKKIIPINNRLTRRGSRASTASPRC